MAGEVYRQSGNFGITPLQKLPSMAGRMPTPQELLQKSIGPISGGKMGAGANVALCHQRSGETESS
ncbi:hypothetical protein [Microseira wollei]|uniref:Uncharacterized protein n=1 Tax=Microseira wollei NIES-4236 TaxID=2530354 RepID=A0AAV3XFS5_9CYAN|nr:hypothetical protein [Microseira wollei]GET39750.1 hypothetical protein MiSe_45220 [Microseira wollei NIES-4236]